ncbi:hypothetical protein ACJX0J_002961, partial [Zea mays]
EDRLTVARARKIERFLSQPFFVAEVFTGSPGKIRLLNDQWLTAVLWSGFARIVNNEIIILGNDAELGSDIDPEEAQQALEIAEANLSKAEGTKELQYRSVIGMFITPIDLLVDKFSFPYLEKKKEF